MTFHSLLKTFPGRILFGIGLICLLAEALPGSNPMDSPAEPKEPENKKLKEGIKEIAGRSEVLRSVAKYFATLKSVDTSRFRVTLLLDGETVAKVWDLVPDAEIKRAGWWARLDQLALEDRVWVWFKVNRKQEPVAVLMLADELSEQDIHGPGVVLEARDEKSLTFKPVKSASRSFQTKGAEARRGKEGAAFDGFSLGEKIYVQSAGTRARLILDSAAFEARRSEQKAALRKRWAEEGLPGTVVFTHLSGEMEFMVDHEGIRWARSLKPGDKVKLQNTSPATVVVRHVRPWRERTQIRLVVAAADLADITLGQRLNLLMEAPPVAVDSDPFPPDMDRPRTKEDRIEWFLSSIYCPCKVRGDRCTGMFYTLASCNPNACAAPGDIRKAIAGKIDKGLTDKQIFEELLKEHGHDMLRPHLLP